MVSSTQSGLKLAVSGALLADPMIRGAGTYEVIQCTGGETTGASDGKKCLVPGNGGKNGSVDRRLGDPPPCCLCNIWSILPHISALFSAVIAGIPGMSGLPPIVKPEVISYGMGED